MTVASILRSKGRDVLTVEPRHTLREVVATLAARGVGAVVVSNASREVLGIVSERDIVRALGREGVAVLDAPVTKYMTQKVFTVDEGASIGEVMERMTEGRFRHAPVVENGRLVGIVSIGDVVKRQIDDLDHERQDLKAYIATA